jgi:RsiW-degrading membrane proteinase PrsW (M82 family)
MAFPAPIFDPRAVIEGRGSGRASVGLIVGTVIAVACALVVLLIYAGDSELRGHSELPFLIAVPLALLPVPLLIALVLFADRLEPEPRVNLIFAFTWGAGVAALLAIIINTLGLEYVTTPALGKTAGQYVSATFGAPPVEETLKGLVLVLLLRLRRQELDGPTDGIIYAAMVGLGFAMMENISYYIDALVKPEIGGAKLLGMTFVMRGVLAPFAHPIFTSMTGLGVAYAATHRRAGWAIFAGWLGAMLLHGTWNGLSRFGLAGLGLAYLILTCVFAGLIAVLVQDRHKTVSLLRRCLPAYVPTGLVTPRDIEMLATLHGRRAARHWARVHGGRPAAKAMADYQLAATELAMLHQRAERGVISAPEFESRRHALLGLMQAARLAFLSQRPQPPIPPWAAQGPSGFIQREAYRAPVPPPGFPPAGPAPWYRQAPQPRRPWSAQS